MIHYPHEDPPLPGASIEVAPGIRWIRMPLPFALNHINLWLLEDQDDDGPSWTIVDTGYGIAETHTLWEQHFTNIFQDVPVKRIIVTHYHPDHVGCAAWLHERTGAPVWMTAAEFLSAHAAAENSAGFDRDNSANLYLQHGLERVKPDFRRAQATREKAFTRGVPTVPKQYIRMMDGDTLRIGARTWRVITAFGHAPEHATLFSADGNILISGDQVLPRITTNVAVWGSQPESNPLKLFLDCTQKFDALPADTLVLPSHDRVFTGLHTRTAELRDHHAKRLNELEAALTAPKTAAEVLPVLFRRALDDHQLVFAMGEAIAHLHYLRADGRVTRMRAIDGAWVFQRR